MGWTPEECCPYTCFYGNTVVTHKAAKITWSLCKYKKLPEHPTATKVTYFSYGLHYPTPFELI